MSPTSVSRRIKIYDIVFLLSVKLDTSRISWTPLSVSSVKKRLLLEGYPK